MTKDLEETLAELGPGYREIVDRLVSAGAPGVARRSRWTRASAAGLAAASLLLVPGLVSLFRAPAVRRSSAATAEYTAAYAADAVSLARLLASQRPDGSWANDFLTQQNAAALAGVHREEARVAYKKAVRYLRTKGLRPLTAAELNARRAAARRFSARG